jgi:hypothetical protein
MTERGESPAVHSDDDLSLQPFLQALWSYRRVMVFTFIAIVLAYVGIILIVYARQPQERVASIGVRLTFEGAEQDRFPNGTKFSSAEIVSTPVLSEVFRRNELQRYASFQDFKDSMFVLQANADLELLSYEYQTKLSDSRIGPVDRVRLEEEFRKKRDSLKSAQLSVNFRRSERLLKMPVVLLNKVLQDTLSTWAQQAAQRKGIVRYDIPVLSNNVLKKDFLAAEDFVIAVDILRSTIERILKSVEDIEKIPGAGSIRYGEQQVGLADVRAHLEDLLRFKVQPLLGEIRVAGLSRNPNRMDLYFEGRLYETQAALAATEERVTTLQEALRTYQQKGGDAGLTPGDSGRGTSVTPQLSESFIDKLVDLSRQSNDIVYRQDLTDRIIDAGMATAELKKQVGYYDAMRKAFTGVRGGTNPRAEADVASKTSHVSDQIGHAVDQIQAIYKLIAEQNLNPDTVLYTVTSPFIVRATSALTLRTVLLYLLITLLVSAIVVPALCLAHDYFRHWVSPRQAPGGPHPNAPSA